MDDDAFPPDTKDWTWVLTRPCPQCRVDVQRYEIRDILPLAERYVHRFRTLLEEDPGAATRPEETTWSALEYGAHLRDVCEVFRTRVRAMLLHEAPSYADWDQNQAALEGDYGTRDPVTVADELETAAADLLRDVAGLTGEETARTGRRSDGFTFTIATLMQYFLHELVHHWWDVSGETFSAERPGG